jgi:centrosomal protein CEP76
MPTLKCDIISAKGLHGVDSQLHEIQWHAQFGKEVRRSEAAILQSAEPVVNFSAEFALDLSQAHQMNPAVLVYLTSTPLSPSEQIPVGAGSARNLVGTATIDYRYAKVYSGDYMSVELMPCEQDGGHVDVNLGTLYVKMSIVDGDSNNNKARMALQTEGDVKEIEFAISNHQERMSKLNRDFILSARAWWARARKQYPHVENRVVKILAEDETGQHRFVSSFVAPHTPPRELINARFAARFVSLVPFKRDMGLTGGRIETWRCAHALLSRVQGDAEDHAILLCGLLLGWGLNAWVALGTIDSSNGSSAATETRAHCWVVTMDASDDRSNPRVTCWETLTGLQYELPTGAGTPSNGGKHHFAELHVLFRHDRYALNVQKTARLPRAESHERRGMRTTSFDLSDPNAWLPLPCQDIGALRHPGANVALSMGPTLDLSALEVTLENTLKDRIADWRLENSLASVFDGELGLILQPALAAYELDRAVGVTFGNADFQAAIKRYVQRGETFKGYPTCFSHADATTIMASLRRTTASSDVALAQGRNVRLAVRVKLFPYPEGVLACWVMLAACLEK